METHKLARTITDADVRAFVRTIGSEMGNLPREPLKDFLKGMIERIELDPTTLTCRICYAIRLSGGDSLRPHGDSNPGYRRERAMS